MSEDKGTVALFDDIPAVSEGGKAVAMRSVVPRLQRAVRDQVE
ncbi:hypothetical protein [Thiomonas bhubaneswarensis]|uniref:Uncharacterized protein n=1 Tax=Thiomonas bhubaneswarensis TaxID=339866 RepID=A0A0K6I2G5_9BURK|nr:hypothetical protein [Thiomonas bhubaneswarensis]CUA97487.1 hypothetical protein Ga0061069_105279 [Thiomonas bhubaneswarensis]